MRRREVNQLEEDIRNLKAMNLKAIAKQYEGMAQALRVIHTWADNDAQLCTLMPKRTVEICDKALRRFK
jgi:hypothetical protein